MYNQQDLLTDVANESEFETRRIKLIPLWIKIFSWIFLVLGCLIPIVIAFGVIGGSADLSLYGFSTQEPLSFLGLAIVTLFSLKGIVAFGIVKEKAWAIKLGILDAIVGIIACAFVMVYPLLFDNTGLNFSFRLELVALIPFLLKLYKIKKQWEGYKVD